ncbi:hypothetical protein [Chitinimonas sp. JJ19]|uniref:hypothetical protein n=1 Tax=Chitinimonas sp. JJ19 TaxID=3109352 RepID=UPI0030022292
MNTKKLIALLLATASLGAMAQRGNLVEIQVEDRYGRDYREYQHRGSAWVAGEQGEAYQVRLRNLTDERVLVVLSVDGVNAVSGETAGYQQTGYVLEPYGDTVVSGWRKSMGSVARFYFTDLGDSYAARTGRPDEVGVIGAAVFRERRYIPPVVIARDRDARAMEESAPRAKSAPSAAPQMGTGHGEIEDSQARRTRFERASTQPSDRLALRYDSRRNLVAAGVIPGRRHQRDEPNPFPQEGFTPDPPRYGWNRR